MYHWSDQLASESWAPFSSFLCGWINLIGNLANSTSFANGCVSIIAASITMYNGYSLSISAQVGLSIGFLLLWALQNIFRIDQQGQITAVGVVFQLFGSFAVVIAALATASAKSSSQFIFTASHNGIGVNSMAYVALIGVLSSLYCYGGFEAGAHLAEETQVKKHQKKKPLFELLIRLQIATCSIQTNLFL